MCLDSVWALTTSRLPKKEQIAFQSLLKGLYPNELAPVVRGIFTCGPQLIKPCLQNLSQIWQSPCRQDTSQTEVMVYRLADQSES